MNAPPQGDCTSHSAPALLCDSPIARVASLEQAVAQTDDGDGLVELQRIVSVVEEASKRFDLAYGEVLRIAVLRLRVGRKLGRHLAGCVRRGGRGSKSPRGTSMRGGASAGLPSGVTKQMAARYRALAAIPEDAFAAYLAQCELAGRFPTATGALRASHRRHGTARTWPRGAREPQEEQTPLIERDLLAAVQRFVGELHLCVGDAPIECAQRLAPDALRSDHLRGNVFVADCREPASLLSLLSRSRRSTRLIDVLVLLAAATADSWFRLLAMDRWHCCFLRSNAKAQMLAYQGHRTDAFRLVFDEFGVVMAATTQALR